MHEMGVAAEVVRIAIEHAQRAGATSVASMKLRVGDWSGVEEQSLRFALEALSDGTLLQGCRVEIERVTPAFRCAECDRVYAGEGYFSACSHCGAHGGSLEQGDELTLAELEVEDR